GREAADAGPLRAVAALRDLLGPGPIVGLGLQQPVRHGIPSSFARAEVPRRGRRHSVADLLLTERKQVATGQGYTCSRMLACLSWAGIREKPCRCPAIAVSG